MHVGKKHVLFLLLKHQEPLGIVEGCAAAEAQRELQELWGVGGEVQALNRGETQVQTLELNGRGTNGTKGLGNWMGTGGGSPGHPLCGPEALKSSKSFVFLLRKPGFW